MSEHEDKMIRPGSAEGDGQIDLSEIRKGLQTFDVPGPLVVSAETPTVSAQPTEPSPPEPPQMTASGADG